MAVNGGPYNSSNTNHIAMNKRWDNQHTYVYDQYNGYGNHNSLLGSNDDILRELALLRSEMRTVMEMVHALQKNLEEMIQDRDFYRIKAEALEAELKKVVDRAE